MDLVNAKDITKSYGNKQALKGVSFQLKRGEIVGLLGRNGAGKSTLLNILTGYIPGNSGSVLIQDIDLAQEPQKAKRHIGYLPEQPPLYDNMTVGEYLAFVGQIKRIPRSTLAKKVEEICEKIGLSSEKNRLIRNLSKGYRQRVGIAQAMIGDPNILILDEPTSGLDPKQILEIRAVIKEFGKDRTVLISSHIISEITEICERALIIRSGRLVADHGITGDETKAETRLHIRVTAPDEMFCATLKDLNGVCGFEQMQTVEPDTTDWIIFTKKEHDIRRELFDRVAAGGWKLLRLEPKEEDLEELFVRLTEGDD